jgi:hypothetical protein
MAQAKIQGLSGDGPLDDVGVSIELVADGGADEEIEYGSASVDRRLE